MNELALFAGAGGGILGGKLLGWRTVCAVEWEPYAAGVLIARQNDGILPPFPIWDDVRTFDGRPWRDRVDVVSGGFPCQDISAAGKGAGIEGERSGMWREMARIIGEVGPSDVLVENSPMLTSRGLGRVLGDLAALGYDARWGVLGAIDAGAPHKRERIWIVAHSDSNARRLQSERELRCGGASIAGLNGQPQPLANPSNDWTGRRQQFEESREGARDVANPSSGRGQEGAREQIWTRKPALVGGSIVVAHADRERELQSQRSECEIGRRSGDGRDAADQTRPDQTLANSNSNHEQGIVTELTHQEIRQEPGERSPGSCSDG